MNQTLRKFGEHLFRSRRYAATLCLIFAFLSFFDMPVGWVTTVIIALVTLQNGMREGLWVMAWAMLPAVAMLYLGDRLVFINIVVLHYLLSFLFASCLRQYKSWSVVLKLGAVLGMFSVVVVHLIYPDVQQWWLQQANSLFKETDTTFKFLNLKKETFQIALDYASRIGTGTVALFILLSNVLNLFLARWWQSIITQTNGLQLECHQIRMNYIAAIVLFILIIGCLGAAFYSKILIDMLPVALMPFILSGLSLLHAMLATKRRGNVVLGLFYGIFLVLSPYVLMFLTFVGFVDSLINFRKRRISAQEIRIDS